MNPLRFFCRPINERTAVLTGREAHHLSAVLRLGVGQTVELFDGAGAWAEAAVTAVEKDRVVLAVQKLQTVPPAFRERIVLAVSLAKADRFEWVISKCTELGVDRICPVRCERTVKQARGERALKRYQHLAVVAAKQCRRLFLPQIDPPASLTDSLEMMRKDYPQGRILLGSLSPQAEPLIKVKWTASDVLAFIGPEGGLTAKEIDLLRQHQAHPVRLTDTTLRIETAALACAAILSAQRTAAS